MGEAGAAKPWGADGLALAAEIDLPFSPADPSDPGKTHAREAPAPGPFQFVLKLYRNRKEQFEILSVGQGTFQGFCGIAVSQPRRILGNRDLIEIKFRADARGR